MRRMLFPLVALLVCVIPATPQSTSAATAQADSASTLRKLNTDALVVYAPELKIPSNAQNQYKEGRKDYLDSKFEEAREHFRLAGLLHPKYSLAYSALAMSLLKLKRFDESHQALDIAIRLNENNSDAVLTLGLLYFCESRFAESKLQLQRVVATFPSEPNARQVLSAMAMLQSDYSEVIRQTDAIEKKDAPRVPTAFLIRGVAFEKLGLAEDARASYERYLRLAGKGRNELEQARASVLQMNAAMGAPKSEPPK